MKQMISELASIRTYDGLTPKLGDAVFLADGARVIGDVEIGDYSSVWYNTVIRGDVCHIRIGSRTSIQDNSMLHVTHDTDPLIIGDGVTVGHAVKLHGCTISDYSLIGIGSIVLDRAVVGTHSIVAAGAVVPPGFHVPDGHMVAGVPAKIIRKVTDEEIAFFHDVPERYTRYAITSWASISE